MPMKDVDQTNPHTNEPFWATRFEPTIVPDGGRKGVPAEETMADVAHESPTDGRDRTFRRGGPGPSDE